jgi:hypothetical protein
VKRHHTLATAARRLGAFVHSRQRRELTTVSAGELDIIAPGRILAGGLPVYVAEIGEDSSGYKQVEIYPPPEESELIHYVYWKLPTTLTLSTTLPQSIDPYTLKEGVLVDLYRFEKSRALRLGNMEAAGHWGNEEARQRTIWRKAIDHAIRSDRGVDDITFIVQMLSGGTRSGDIKTARDDLYARWNYPGL